jgi:iron complex transport system substrate-binding protein
MKLKKLTTLFATAILTISAAGCATQSQTTPEKVEVTVEHQTASSEQATEQIKDLNSITVKSYNAQKELIDLEVPYNPQRIAILDLASLDILDAIGMGERVVGMANTSIAYLSSYSENTNLTNLGTIKEADLEAVMSCEPDVIFIGGRLANSYDALSEIAPVIYLGVDSEVGVVKSVANNAYTIASLFGLESEVEAKLSTFDERIQKLSDAYGGKTALVGMATSGSFNLLTNSGRCSIIGKEIGFENLTQEENSSAHGNESSFEVIVKQNPEYLFVLDRDSAIGTEGAQFAQEIIENELVMKTDAYKNGNIIYLANPNVWYTAEGGIQALDIMLSDLETVLN